MKNMKLRKFMKIPAAAMAVALCLPLAAATTTKTNFWIGASGGDWRLHAGA